MICCKSAGLTDIPQLFILAAENGRICTILRVLPDPAFGRNAENGWNSAEECSFEKKLH